MDLVEVEITVLVITARYGTLQSGAILRTDKEFADHLVNDCAAAKYNAKQVLPAALPASTVQTNAPAPEPEPEPEAMAVPTPEPTAPAPQDKPSKARSQSAKD